MRKSFKKVVACLLAVLMVTFSVPFTALASPDDWKPNFTLQFNTFVEDTGFNTEGITSTNFAQKSPSYSLYSGVHGAPLDYEGSVNKKDGSLELSKLYLENSKVQGILDYNGLTADDYAGEVTGQTNYEEGMPFAVSVKLNNVSTLYAYELYLDYSDNIAPAVVWKSGARAATATGKVGTKADYEADKAKSKTLVTPDTSVIDSATNYYANVNNEECSADYLSRGYMYSHVVGDGTVENEDFSKINNDLDNGGDDAVINPKTCKAGYDCADDAILVTYIFVVTGEVSASNPIKFSLHEGIKGCPGGATASIGKKTSTDEELASYDKFTDTQPGQYHVYFMGYNAKTGESLGAAEHTHTAGEPTQENVVPATCTADGSYDEVIKCTECGEEMSRTHKTIAALGHKYVDTVVDPTCTVQGYTLHKCSVCGDELKDTYTKALGHEYGAWITDTPATEDAVGSKHRDCVRGDDRQTEEIPKLTHVHTPAAAVKENEVPATCETDGSYDEVVRCSKCGEEMSRTHKTTPALGHDWKVKEVVAPTYESEGYTLEECANCHETRKTNPTAKLDGVKLTVDGKYSSYGSVEGYDFDKATWAGKNSTVTLKAMPIEGAVFAGWEIDGKVVSTADTLELTMYKDITVTPIFQEEQKSTITVVFLDMYNNVTASYTNMTAADFQAEMAKAIPTPAEYPGYTFAGWSKTDDDIKALDTSATITSSYETRGNSYTVNAQGAKITVNGETKADKFADIAYDTEVTVSADNAKAWAIDGTTVAVGSSYTFYLGSDVTITPVTNAVDDAPMTAIVSAAPATADSYRVSFLASSYIPAGYTVIDRGFVYGKGATQDELTLAKVGTTIAATGAKVKSISVPTNKDTVNDFGLVYGVKNKDAAATAVAYVTVKSMADDSVKTVYSTISEFNY